jgi:hypothetical protein
MGATATGVGQGAAHATHATHPPPSTTGDSAQNTHSTSTAWPTPLMRCGETVENQAPIATNAWKQQLPTPCCEAGETARGARAVCKMAEQNEGNFTRYLPFNNPVSSYHTPI